MTEAVRDVFAIELNKRDVVTAPVNPLTGGSKNLVAGGLVFPVRNGIESLSIGVLGDSISNQCFDISTSYGAAVGDTALSSYGWISWWQYFSGANLEFTDYATAGFKTYNVLAGLQTALAGNHDIYTLAPIGINDDISGDESVANINTIVETLVRAGKRVVLGTPTPNASFATSAGRISTIMAGMRSLAIKYPAQVRLADYNRLLSNPSDSTGANYVTFFDSMTYDVDTAATHPNLSGAMSMGALVHKVTAEWTAPFTFPVTRGDTGNLLPNGQFGGTTGTITSAGANSVSPDGWTASRGSAAVTYSMHKAKRLPLIWKTGITYPVGSRIVPPVPNGMHYISLTSAATGATAPSAITLFGQSTPDVGGPVYLTVPANTDGVIPEVGEDLLVLGSSSTISASDHCGLSNVTIDATAMQGKRVKCGLWVESLGSVMPLVQLRIDQHDSSNARIIGAFGMMANAMNGTTKNPHHALLQGNKGLVATPSFVIAPNCVQLRIHIRAYQPGGGYQTAVMLSDAFIAKI